MIKKIINRKIIIILILLTLVSFTTVKVASTNSLNLKVSRPEYTEEFKAWLELSDEEKQKVLMPKMFVSSKKDNSKTYIFGNAHNVLKKIDVLQSSSQKSFRLIDYIPENLTIKNQKDTKTCWAFSSIAALETTLAMQNYKNSKPVKVYDFSERHMEYSTVRSYFLNGKLNLMGFTRDIKNGGNFYMAMAYLTNGLGAINEPDMPFENNMNYIDISNIENKTVQTTVKDIKEFPDLTDTNRLEMIGLIKHHIENYGAVSASCFNADIDSPYFNNSTGALYVNIANNMCDHAIALVGWNDNYSKDNFNEDYRPSSNGAWIAKNSWGERLEYTITQLRQKFFNALQDELIGEGILSPNQIPAESIIQALKEAYGESKVTTSEDGTKVYVEIGDKGFIYVSYEDLHIYNLLMGIQNASDSKEYDNIYQNDYLGPENAITVKTNENVYVANVFTRDNTNETESLTAVNAYSFEGGQYELYINPNGSDKSLSSLQKVEFKEGSTCQVEQGYHVLELKNPIHLSGNSFTVVLKTDEKNIPVESKIEKVPYWRNAIVNPGESFFSTESAILQNVWQDLAEGEDEEHKRKCMYKGIYKEYKFE